MKYLAVVDSKNVGEMKVFGDGMKAQKQCLDILKFSYRVGDKKLSITKIAEGTGLPRMNIYFFLKDYEIRQEQSTLYKVAKEKGYKLKVDLSWNKENKSKRVKRMISVEKIEERL